jgi:hypothetical protein
MRGKDPNERGRVKVNGLDQVFLLGLAVTGLWCAVIFLEWAWPELKEAV